MRHDPFDPSRDEALGRLLREHLSPSGDAASAHAAFAARVRGAIARNRHEGAWDVLGRWSRPGIVAAACVAFAIGLWLGLGWSRVPAAPDTIGEAMRPADAPSQLFVNAGGADAMLAAVVEGP